MAIGFGVPNAGFNSCINFARNVSVYLSIPFNFIAFPIQMDKCLYNNFSCFSTSSPYALTIYPGFSRYLLNAEF
ncbi:hypothetical protein A4H97_14635 [Niastella yeongjuensis]|uniref:Uncharacterized protein n=1 Tax=Niastella yeongjuensis TaxID=354355 RepID=A0A1V9E414_9BACT|nr:hypothetical protein A4H97_14635 [Niastella yeongjuensis]